MPSFSYRTNTRINTFHGTKKDILLVIKSLDSSKSHGYDDLSVKMIKICSASVTVPLKIIFEQSLNDANFK